MDRLLSLKINPDLQNNQNETPLFEAIKRNQPDCVRRLINAGAKLSLVNNGCGLHMAVEYRNIKLVQALLPISDNKEGDIRIIEKDINSIDNEGNTAVYYAIKANSYDIVQRFLDYSVSKDIHLKATKHETLLQFYTERNDLGQYDNVVVRVLECERKLHLIKPSVLICLQEQLGTSESSTKATNQLKSMYKPTKAQRYCRNFWLFLSCILLPSVLSYLDVGTDIHLAREYYNDAHPEDSFRRLNVTVMNCNNQTAIEDAEVMGDLDVANFTAINCKRTFTYIEEQIPIKADSNSKKSFQKYRDLKHLAQMRVAITSVMETTLESAFQLILQLYIVGTQYTELKEMSGQVFSVVTSLISLIWSFTSYHRFSKFGGLTILKSIPLSLAIFFQVISRAISCTLFTLAYTWRILIVLIVHFILVFVFKLKLEKRSLLPDRQDYCCQRLLLILRSYFYVFLGTLASTLVYFRLERPSAEREHRSSRKTTVKIQVLFLLLALVENFILLIIGIGGLDRERYDSMFIIVSVVLCLFSYIIGVVLQYVYYKCFGHPWVGINGPNNYWFRKPTLADIELQVARLKTSSF